MSVSLNQTERTPLEHEQTEALGYPEALFRSVANTAPVLLWVAGADGLLTFVYDPWLRFTGRTLEQELGNGWADGIHPEDRDRCVETYRTALRARQPFTMEYRLCRFDGVYRWLVCSGIPHLAPDGTFIGYVGSDSDITERKQAESALQESEGRYRDLVESQTDLVCRFRPDGTLTFVNAAYCQHYGCSPEKLIGRRVVELVNAHRRDGFLAHLAALVAQPHTAVDEHAFIRPDGSTGWLQWIDHPITDVAGYVIEIQSVGRDVTERKQAEEAVRESAARFWAAFDSATVGMMLVDTDGHPLQVNQPVVEMLGYTENELRTHSFAEFTHPDDVEPQSDTFSPGSCR